MPFIFIWNILRYIYWNNFYYDLHKTVGKEKFLKEILKALKSNDKAIEDLRIYLLFNFSDELEDIIKLVEEGGYSQAIRFKLACRIIDCMDTKNFENFQTLYVSHLKNPQKHLIVFRLCKKLPPSHWGLLIARSTCVLEPFEYNALLDSVRTLRH